LEFYSDINIFLGLSGNNTLKLYIQADIAPNTP